MKNTESISIVYYKMTLFFFDLVIKIHLDTERRNKENAFFYKLKTD